MDQKKIEKEIIEIGRRLWSRSMVAANDGNISVKIDNDIILTTATGVSKGFMDEEDIVTVDLTGKQISHGKKPSSELPMHLEIYKRREDINAIVHAHPPIATGFAAAGMQLDRSILPEVILTLGNVTLTPYETTGTLELAKIAADGIKNHNGILLQNHGAVTVGSDIWQAYFRMETLEHFAHITLVTRILGRQSVLSEEEIGKLTALRMKQAVSEYSSGDATQSKSDKILISRDELIDLIHKVLEGMK